MKIFLTLFLPPVAKPGRMRGKRLDEAVSWCEVDTRAELSGYRIDVYGILWYTASQAPTSRAREPFPNKWGDSAPQAGHPLRNCGACMSNEHDASVTCGHSKIMKSHHKDKWTKSHQWNKGILFYWVVWVKRSCPVVTRSTILNGRQGFDMHKGPKRSFGVASGSVLQRHSGADAR